MKTILSSITQCRGYSLIELMMATVIVAILGSISVGYYGEYIKSGHRSEAKSVLMQAANALERYRTENNTYVGFNLSTSGILSDIDGIYTVTSTTQTATTYALTAAPVDGKIMAGDGDFTLAHTGAKTYKGNTGWND